MFSPKSYQCQKEPKKNLVCNRESRQKHAARPLQGLSCMPPGLQYLRTQGKPTTLYYKICTKHFPVWKEPEMTLIWLWHDLKQIWKESKAGLKATSYYKACTKFFPVLLCTTKHCTKYFPVLLCTTRLAQSTSQYYFCNVLHALDKVLPRSSEYYFCTTNKACTKYFALHSTPHTPHQCPHFTPYTPHFTLLSWLPRSPTPATFCSNSYKQRKTHLNAANTQGAANRAPPPEPLPRKQDPFNTHSGKRKKNKATRKNKHFPEGILWPFQATLLIYIYMYMHTNIYIYIWSHCFAPCD